MKTRHIAMGLLLILLIAMGICAYKLNENNQFQDQIVKQQLCRNSTFLVYVTGLNESRPHELSNYTILNGICKGETEYAGYRNLGEDNNGPYEIFIDGPDVQSLNITENRLDVNWLENGSLELNWKERNYTAIREN